MAFPFRRREEVIGSAAHDAFYCGRYCNWPDNGPAGPRSPVGPKIQIGGSAPIIVIGPNRSGKDSCLGTYALLQAQGGVTNIWNDPRGEAGAVAGPYLSSLGPTENVNPFGVAASIPGYADLASTGWAPLSGLKSSDPMLFDHVAGISEALVKLDERNPHFSYRARGLLSGLIIEEIWEAEKTGRVALLTNVRTAATEADEYDANKKPIKGLAARAARLLGKINPQVDSLLSGYAVDNEETQNVRATLDGATLTLLSQPIRDDELKNGLRMEELGERPASVFLTMPPEMVQSKSIHAPYMRLFFSSALRTLFKPNKTLVRFWLNEFAALGRLSAVEASIGLVAGYSIQVCVILQSLAQLRQLYDHNFETFIGNAAAVIHVGPLRDDFTADYLSKRSGETTIAQPNIGLQLNPGGVGLSNGEGYTRRNALMKQDLYKIPPGHGYVWVAGLSNPIPVYFPAYWDVERLAQHARANPYYRG